MTSPVDGVTIKGKTITFDTAETDSNLDKKVLDLCKKKVFDCIRVEGLKYQLGDILLDIANNCKEPKVIELSLFDKNDDLVSSEKAIREIFSKWKGKNIEIIFKTGELAVKRFKL